MSNGNSVEIIGAVVDVEFPRDSVPKVYDALTVSETGLTLEVQQQLGDGVVRSIAMGSSDALARGIGVLQARATKPRPGGDASLARGVVGAEWGARLLERLMARFGSAAADRVVELHAAALLERAESWQRPFVLAGDFNCTPNSPAHRLLAQRLASAYAAGATCNSSRTRAMRDFSDFSIVSREGIFW